MIGQRELTFEDYKSIAKRRIWLLTLPALVCAIAAFAISLFLHSRYSSETVVLVEEPTVPENFVKPIVGGDVNQRLATMQEQILSRTRLQQIIEKFGLYRNEVGRVPTEELVARLRTSITVSPVRPMAETRASGLPGFTVSVTASQAYLAQQICSEITSSFMQQNVLLRARRAEDTTEFLTKQLQDAKGKLDQQEAKVAEFQRRNMGKLPDEMQTNFSLLTGLAAQLDVASQAISRAQQDKVFIESMLDQSAPVTRASAQPTANPDDLERQLSVLKDRLASLQPHYTDEYPEVRKTKKAIAEVEKQIQEQAAHNPPPNPVTDTKPAVETAQARQLRAQLMQAESTIRERSAEQTHLHEEISQLQAKLEMSPMIAQEYKALTRDYQTAQNIYNDLLKKQSDSEMATDLERLQEGEQFRVLDPPSLPQKPIFPNRPLFAGSGFVIGLGIGLAMALALEARDTSLRTERDLEQLLKLPALGVIPVISFQNAKKRSKTNDAPPSIEPTSVVVRA